MMTNQERKMSKFSEEPPIDDQIYELIQDLYQIHGVRIILTPQSYKLEVRDCKGGKDFVVNEWANRYEVVKALNAMFQVLTAKLEGSHPAETGEQDTKDHEQPA
jgi:hypothetical protein